VELGGERLWHGAHPSCELVLIRLGDNQTLGSPLSIPSTSALLPGNCSNGHPKAPHRLIRLKRTRRLDSTVRYATGPRHGSRVDLETRYSFRRFRLRFHRPKPHQRCKRLLIAARGLKRVHLRHFSGNSRGGTAHGDRGVSAIRLSQKTNLVVTRGTTAGWGVGAHPETVSPSLLK
jgi:hypothetical protein